MVTSELNPKNVKSTQTAENDRTAFVSDIYCSGERYISIYKIIKNECKGSQTIFQDRWSTLNIRYNKATNVGKHILMNS